MLNIKISASPISEKRFLGNMNQNQFNLFLLDFKTVAETFSNTFLYVSFFSQKQPYDCLTINALEDTYLGFVCKSESDATTMVNSILGPMKQRFYEQLGEIPQEHIATAQQTWEVFNQALDSKNTRLVKMKEGRAGVFFEKISIPLSWINEDVIRY